MADQVIGGGPAAAAAGIYAARKRLRTLFLAKEFGGQSIVSEDIQNWIGTVSISGAELAENLKKHLAIPYLKMIIQQMKKIKIRKKPIVKIV